MTMDSRPHRIGVTGLGGLARFAGFPKLAGRPGLGGSDRPETAPAKTFTSRLAALLAVLIAGVGAWLLLSGHGSSTAEREPVRLAAAAITEPLQLPIPEGSEQESLPNPEAAAPEAAAPEAAPVNGLKISSQSWRRGGLGSKALVTLTLRNGNDYAVKDIEIFCSFTRRDGSHLTDRRRVIHETVNMKSRKTFARMHVGFVNVNASQAKCSLVAASRVQSPFTKS
ncbi:MAG: hypothetical protein Q8K88_02415 [Bradyrhizobium sp.]|nr:hypothetical protein [Bradyrhizobium sp.]